VLYDIVPYAGSPVNPSVKLVCTAAQVVFRGYITSTTSITGFRASWESITTTTTTTTTSTTMFKATANIELVVIGGRARDFTNSDSETLDLDESSWTLSSEWQLPKTRDLFGCAWSDTYGIVVAGGRLYAGSGTTTRDCSRASFNCQTTPNVIARKPGAGQQWITLPNLNAPRFRFALVAVDNNQLLAVGGQTSESARIYSVELFDGERWRTMQSMPQLDTRLTFFDAALFAGEVYVTGYLQNSRPALLIFSVSANTWRIGPAPIAEGLSAAVFQGALHIIGDGGHQRYKDGKWHQVTPSLVPRRVTRLTAVAGRLYVIGGYELRLDHQNDVESFDGTTWRREPTMLRKRFLPGVVVLQGNKRHGTAASSSSSSTTTTPQVCGAGQFHDGMDCQSCPTDAYLAEVRNGSPGVRASAADLISPSINARESLLLTTLSLSQSDSCTTGYYKLGRCCMLFAVPPTVNGGLATRVAQIPLTTPVNTTLLSIEAEAEASFGPATFQVDSPLLRITLDGSVELVTALDSATTFSATITVRDNRTSCTVLGPLDQPITTIGPCAVTIPVTIRVAVFLSCPANINIFVGLDKTTAEVTWEEPRLPAFLGVDDLAVSRELGGTSSSRAPFLYPIGQHRVTYTSDPLSFGGSITCAFDVVVRPGYSMTVSSIARRTLPHRVQEFLVVELGEANEGVRLASIEGELQVGRTLSIGVVSPAGAPFAVTPVMGHKVHLVVDLEWCRDDASFDASELMPGALAVDFVTVSDRSRPPAFSNLGSGMTADGGCIRIRGRSAPTTNAIFFRELTASLTLDDDGSQRQRRASEASNSSIYIPARKYQVAVVTEAVDGGELSSLAGSTALEDTQPPVFLNCPVTQIEVTAAPGALTAAASWEELAAVDNIVANPVVTNTHSSGATFSILASPHTVIYTASDGVLTSACSFEVVVTYVAVTVSAVDRINSTFPATLEQSPLRYTTTVQQALMGDGLGVAETLTSLDTADFTELRIELAAPAGQPIALRTRPEAVKSQLVVQLAWGRADRDVDGPVPEAQTDVGVRLDFEGLVLEESEQTGQLTDDELVQSLQPINRFRAARAAVDPASGFIGVLEAYTLPFRRGVHFDKLMLVFQVPAGRNSSGPAAQWTLLSGSGIWAEYGYEYEAAPDLSVLSGFVALRDTEPPMFISCPAGMIVVPTLAGLNYALPLWPLPQVEDNSGKFELRATHALGQHFILSLPSDAPAGIEYTATDAFDNSANCSFSVRVIDEEPPVLVMPLAFEVRLPPAPRSQVAIVPLTSIMPTAMSDNSRFQVVLQSPAADAVLDVGTHVLTARAVDAWGNVATDTVTVTVVDDTPPILICPPDLTVPPPLQLDAAVRVEWASPTIDDNDWDGASNKLKLALSKPSGSAFKIGTEVIVATVTDASQNFASCSFNVTVAAPTLTQTSMAGDDNSASLFGGVGAGIVSLLVIVIAAVLVRRSRRKLPQNWDEIFEAMEQFKDKTGLDGPNIPREIVRGTMTLLEELGKGAFGVVWKGLLKEEPKRPGYLVAAKSLHETCTATDKQVCALGGPGCVLGG
jgi:hypothetical protein